jgi:hypothetical protein
MRTRDSSIGLWAACAKKFYELAPVLFWFAGDLKEPTKAVATNANSVNAD